MPGRGGTAAGAVTDTAPVKDAAPTPSFPVPSSPVTDERCLVIARAKAESQGWPWEAPIGIGRSEAFSLFGRKFGRSILHVRTNINRRGRNVNIHVGAGSGEIVLAPFAKR